MKNLTIKSYCKINLLLRVLKKSKTGYHNIVSLITFSKPYDVISITKINGKVDKVCFSGEFKKGINKKSNTVTKTLNLLRKKKIIVRQSYKVNIKKNIPHGSGLGGGSSNAADLLNYFNSKIKKKLTKKKIGRMARKIGFDVPICLEKKNTLLTEKNKILRFNKKFNLNLLIVFPNFHSSTKKVYQTNNKFSLPRLNILNNIKKKENLIDFLKKEENDLQKTVIKIYPKISKIIDHIQSLKGCYFSRITGSGSACIGIFSNMRNAINAKKSIRFKYPKYWSVSSKTI